MTTLVFDLGGPLATETLQIPSSAKALGLEDAAVQTSYWEHRTGYDAGSATDVAYWSAVAGREVDEELATRLGVADAEAWVAIRPAARAILAEVHATGTPLWVLSNAPAPMQAAIDASDWRSLVSGRFVSGVLQMMKPDDEIYAHVEAELGRSGSELAFIDDRADNIAAAAARGWRTHLWRDDDDTRAWLVELGILA